MRVPYESKYQKSLIGLATIVVILLGAFFYFELFPEYKDYQSAYVKLEEFKSKETGEPVPEFSFEIKQIMIPSADNGPEVIDRCTSCHVAVDLPHFSPVLPRKDINGQVVYNEKGYPVMEENPEYIWGRLEKKIAELVDPTSLKSLREQGKEEEVSNRLTEAEELRTLRWKWDSSLDHEVDLSRVLKAHPFLEGEEQLFGLHPIEEFGCTSCHSGNGRSVVAKRAHGPYFDQVLKDSHAPSFTEIDEENDPRFSKVFNERPDHDLLFQTTPILTGNLIQSRCVQCHQNSQQSLEKLSSNLKQMADKEGKRASHIAKSEEHDLKALQSLHQLWGLIREKGVQGCLDYLEGEEENFTLSGEALDQVYANKQFIEKSLEKGKGSSEKRLQKAFVQQATALLGNKEKAVQFLRSKKPFSVASLQKLKKASGQAFKQKQDVAGTLFSVEGVLQNLRQPISYLAKDSAFVSKITPSLNRSMDAYHRGELLFFNNACYSCHRMEGLSRGGVGPDLSEIGLSYPWYVKESIVHPQADLPSSVMPNYRLDHADIEDLMTYLMAHRGPKSTKAAMEHASNLKRWEEGEKNSWEKAVSPKDMTDVKYGMRVFATEGCSACHKLQGFESDWGFTGNKEEQKVWFSKLFPEGILGSEIVRILDTEGSALLEKIEKVQNNSLLTELDLQDPELIPSYYTHFRFASRAKNAFFDKKLSLAKTDKEKRLVQEEKSLWQDLVKRTLMLYIQEYGFGRDIAPKLNYSGIYRSTEWLMGHFKNPSYYTTRSFMPTFPFDETKFYALTYMLEELGKKNRNALHKSWKERGFDPSLAYKELCSSCHGVHQGGNGPISEMLYPIPKNLRNATFLQNLTKERALESILQGVKGTPMAPWGSGIHPVLAQEEAKLLVDWLYADLPGDYLQTNLGRKWKYTPKDVVKEMEKEQEILAPMENSPNNSKELFVSTENSSSEADPKLYYLRKEFYTAQNIDEGKELFATNCAHCHGKDADGTGMRSVTMDDAKPRALTNLSWLQSRDDMRLLRSIKFGVPGTSMTPWGDKTSMKQRLQMLVFIRSLTEQKKLSDQLLAEMYRLFGRGQEAVNSQRTSLYASMGELEEEVQKISIERQNLLVSVEQGKAKASDLASLYQKEVEAELELKSVKEKDANYLALIELIKEERGLYEAMGEEIIDRLPSSRVWQNYQALLQNKVPAFIVQEGKLLLSETTSLQQAEQEILKGIQESLKERVSRRTSLLKKFVSTERKEQIESLSQEIDALTNLHTEVARRFLLSQKLQKKQEELYQKIRR